jgi:fructose-bisphosphate aldolase class II
MKPVSLNEIISYSKKYQVGIGMFNIVNLEFAQAIFDASQETELPVMFGMPEGFLKYYNVEVMTLACKKLIENAKAPISIHLDHGRTFEGIMTALRAGFSSIMFDGSSLDYEENVAKTSEIVKIGNAFGGRVEGDLGSLGNTKEAVNSDNFTKPDQAVDFVKRTGVDALAIAIGNQHGPYKGVPKLDFDRLKEIRQKVECGLVLHGGSGIAPQDFVEAVRCGINKINIHTANEHAAQEFTKKSFGDFSSYLAFTKGLTEVVKNVVKEHMLIFAEARK